ncbi:hypothetical protein TRFO_18593 [Tritrichomonas foetus]|uniref:Uncharacterized protein n=1 Tax=Tritrichomonas foetus TaxID=1144522 RepID=A0A1J4KKZ4_9EUKA|nr:hypothetical protein TRFO_18593 [Tritrichomonas foetus]|eukprot:OHT11810.1 hypothetical protein TRFO_18593 [Tritrichomonas foetus]
MTESNQRTNETQADIIARDWQIANPIPVCKPKYTRGAESFPFPVFQLYNEFVNKILPTFELNVNVIPSAACQFLTKAVDTDCDSPFLYQMLIRAFLLSCQKEMLYIMAHPSLTRTSLLHNELVNAAEMIKKRELSAEMVNFCDMMLADALDLYHSSFSDVIDNNFWAKTKTVDELINQFLKKEIERLRLLSPYTFNQLGAVIMRKSIDSAPASSVGALKKWGTENNVPFE